ncbi:MAG TPA: aminotransferase class I/II-fold pyridoxal phosphate-dependent enzyme [Cytophagaceae bacterium]|nr:aminotransferase class I/II-fold pyridoxal phosphate-dependent enzyme [Cytophagaceae bacterium]
MTKKRIYLSPPHLGDNELKYIKDAFEQNWITTSGDNLDAFEKEICNNAGVENCVALNSGTAAIHLALLSLGIEKGDEVICSSFTFIASANPIVYVGATPVFVDSETDTWNMSPELLEKAILDRIKKGKKPKAIVVVHLFGQPAKLNELIKIASAYEIPILEDAAESLGSTYGGKMTGSFGSIGIYSFNGNKIITTSGGGALITNNKQIAEKAKFLATQARDKAPHYQHSETGYNYRMSNVLAGIGLGQLEVLQNRIKRKRAIFDYYKKQLEPTEKFSFLGEFKNTYSNRWLTVIISLKENPEVLKAKLEADSIESRPVWKPLHLQPVFKDAPAYVDGTSEQLFEKGLCLPSGTAMTEEDMNRIILLLK